MLRSLVQRWSFILLGGVLVVCCIGTRFIPRVQERTGTKVISDASAYKSVYVISDVHGMYQNLFALLKASQIIDENGHWAAQNSLLIVTGDSIDKGPQSVEVLDLWIQLKTESQLVGGDVIHTLGNHEAEFLANPDGDDKAQALIDELNKKGIPVSDLTGTDTERGRFLHSEPVAVIVGKWLFSHSGYFPDMTWDQFASKSNDVISNQQYGDDFLIGDDSILETKGWELDSLRLPQVLSRLDRLGIYGEVFGHQPGAFGIKGRSASKAQGRLIKIDNGMAPEAGAHPGSVLIFMNPSEMNAAAYPSIVTINPEGTAAVLSPE